MESGERGAATSGSRFEGTAYSGKINILNETKIDFLCSTNLKLPSRI
jgi:hypothetical protein